MGAPAVPANEACRQYAALQRLPEMRKRMRALEQDLVELKRLTANLAEQHVPR